jgi:hypothetical protein
MSALDTGIVHIECVVVKYFDYIISIVFSLYCGRIAAGISPSPFLLPLPLRDLPSPRNSAPLRAPTGRPFPADPDRPAAFCSHHGKMVVDG